MSTISPMDVPFTDVSTSTGAGTSGGSIRGFPNIHLGQLKTCKRPHLGCPSTTLVLNPPNPLFFGRVSIVGGPPHRWRCEIPPEKHRTPGQSGESSPWTGTRGRRVAAIAIRRLVSRSASCLARSRRWRAISLFIYVSGSRRRERRYSPRPNGFEYLLNAITPRFPSVCMAVARAYSHPSWPTARIANQSSQRVSRGFHTLLCT